MRISVILATLGSLLVCGSSKADCIDYGEYLHLAGRVVTPGDARGVAVSGDYAYVADEDSGLQVIDITNPEAPQTISSVDTPGDALGVAVSGSHVCVADGFFGGLQVIDVTNPGKPRIVGSVETSGDATGLPSRAATLTGWTDVPVCT